jgi:uncharacterized protein YkwD
MKTLTLISFLLLVTTFFSQGSYNLTDEEFHYEYTIKPLVKFYESIDFDSINTETIKNINKYRKENNLPYLSIDTSLTNYAKNYSDYLVSTNQFKHSDISKYGVRGENLHKTFTSSNAWVGGKQLILTIPTKIVFCWTQSEGHNEQMLRSDITKIGLYVATKYTGERFKMICVMAVK